MKSKTLGEEPSYIVFFFFFQIFNWKNRNRKKKLFDDGLFLLLLWLDTPKIPLAINLLVLNFFSSFSFSSF